MVTAPVQAPRRYKEWWFTLPFVVLLCVGTVITGFRYLGCSKNDNHELYLAIAAQDSVRVRQLLANGSSPNSRERCYFDEGGDQIELRTDPEKNPPVLDAIKNSNAEIVKILLEAGADPNLPGEEDQNSLMVALAMVKYEIVPILLTHGANPNWQDPKTGTTPLIVSAQTNAIPNMKALLAAGANPNARDHQGKTALAYAFSDGEAKGLLAKYGATP